MKNKVVDIILVNYNSFNDTIECITSISNSSYKFVNIIVVDNNSSDDSINEIKKRKLKCYDYYFVKYCSTKKMYDFCDNVKESNNVFVISSDSNNGFSYANNVAINFSNKYLNSSFCWILNNDTIISGDSIHKLLAKIELDNNAMLGATIMEYYNPNVIQRIAGNYYYAFFGYVKPYNKSKMKNELNNIKAKFNYLTGCSIFTTYKIINDLDGFDERFFLYAEDKDLCKRALKNGVKLVWCKDAIIYHKGGNSIGTKNIRRESSMLSEYYTNYSAFIFNRKWYKLYKIFSFNRYFLKILKFKIAKKKEKVKIVKKAYKDYKELDWREKKI